MFPFLKKLRTELAPIRDHAALATVDHQIQNAMRTHLETRRALALAVAAEEREAAQHQAVTSRIDDLETRAVAALRGGRDDLAGAAAHSIAVLEAERHASREASLLYRAEIAKSREHVDLQRRRLADLDRGRRLARISAALGNAARRSMPDADGLGTAEMTLAAIRDRHAEDASIHAALASPETSVIEDMATAGFGAPSRPRAVDIFARIKAKASHPALAGPEANSNAN